MSEECVACGGGGWVASGDTKTAHMRGRATFRPCPACNRVESDELEAAAERAQREIAELIRERRHADGAEEPTP